MQRLVSSLVSAGAVAAAVVLVPSAQAFAATTVTCGEVITTNITMANSLTDCPGDGLDIGASGITIKMAGHTISGTNLSTYGINIGGYSNVTIKNGWIMGFPVGVYASNVDSSDNVVPTDAVADVLTGIHANRDGNGIFLQGTNDTVSSSQANNDDDYGISEFDGMSTTFSHDTASYDADGIQASGDGQSATGSTQITDCVASHDSGDGIQLIREVNDTVTGNTAARDYNGIEADQLDSTSTVTGNQATYDHTGFYIDGSGYLGENGVPGAGSSGVELSYNTAEFDNYGFYDFLNVSGYPDTLTDNVATTNYHAGIYLEGTSGAVVQDNTASTTKTSGDGIYVDATASGTQVDGNTTNTNTNDGIYAGDSTATLTGNTANDNDNTGIDAAPGDTDGGGNTATGNSAAQCVNVSC